jgi:hypothetical protein
MTAIQSSPVSTASEVSAAAYSNLINLLSVYAEASNRMGVLQNDADSEFIELIDGRKTEYAQLQQAISDSEAAMEVLALAHPEWFAEAKSVKTPFGTVKLTKSTTLSIKNPEVSLVLIEKHEDPTLADRLIRTEKALNVEALEQLSDEELKALRIKRVTDQKFSVKPASIDLGKAVKSAAAKKGVAK